MEKSELHKEMVALQREIHAALKEGNTEEVNKLQAKIHAIQVTLYATRRQ